MEVQLPYFLNVVVRKMPSVRLVCLLEREKIPKKVDKLCPEMGLFVKSRYRIVINKLLKLIKELI